MQTITKMAPINPIEQLKQMHDAFEIILSAQSVTEDMLKAYENHGEDPTAMDDEQLLEDIQQFYITRIMEFATETRSTHPEKTDEFMKSNGYGWNDNPEDGDIGYFW